MIIGIDLGTSNSLVSYFTENGPKIIPNRLGKNITRSVVSIDNTGQILVGDTAREQLLLDRNSGAHLFKRNIGSNKAYSLRDKSFTSEELSSFIIRALKEDAESYLGEKVTEAVISVPAYFNEQRRRATKRAGELAGLKVDRIISEPTAAAIAYGLYKEKQNSKFLVFDLGGGTFDVSILEMFSNIIEVRAVAGDNYIGGEDFTKILVDLFLSKNLDIITDELTLKQHEYIRKQAEICKLAFSKENISKFVCNINEKVYEENISIDEYELACSDLLAKIKEPIRRSLADANIRISQIDRIVMVGGGTKLPIIKRFVAKLFRMMPYTNINPDETVALGAAIQGALKSRDTFIKEVVLTDVCPFTLGTEVVQVYENNRHVDGMYCPIIDRNTVIPTSRTKRLFTTYDNQSKVRINILQGESRFAKNNLSLGELVVTVPRSKAGEESIDVTYTYDINSLLEVEVTVISTGIKTKQIISNSDIDVSVEEAQKRFEELSYMKIHPREREENKLLLLQGERLYEESIGNDRLIIENALKKFEDVLESQIKDEIDNAREDFKDFLKNAERSYR